MSDLNIGTVERKEQLWKQFLEQRRIKHGGDCHVATSTRDMHPSILKYGWLRTRGIGRRTKRGTNLQKQSDTDFEGVPGIVSLSFFLDIFGC